MKDAIRCASSDLECEKRRRVWQVGKAKMRLSCISGAGPKGGPTGEPMLEKQWWYGQPKEGQGTDPSP